VAQFERGEGVWPSSLWMADGCSNGRIRRGPEARGPHRWQCVKGAVEERARHSGMVPRGGWRRRERGLAQRLATLDHLAPNLAGPKGAFPCSKKMEIKYGWREFGIRNNFAPKGFLRFEIDIELKFREASMS
jgi:hypothetical protein